MFDFSFSKCSAVDFNALSLIVLFEFIYADILLVLILGI